MSFASFGIGSKHRNKRLKETPLAEFADPTDDHPPALDTYTAEEKVVEADKLQAEGNERAESRDYSAAIRLWDRATIFAPSRAILYELKAQVFLEIDHLWEAVYNATEATKLDPEWPDGFVTLAHAQLAFGEPEAALQQMEKALSLQVAAVYFHSKSGFSKKSEQNRGVVSLICVTKYCKADKLSMSLVQPGHAEASAEIDNLRMLVLRREKDPTAAGRRLRVV